jgi:4-oxalocrotonate tautomerase
MPHVIVKMHAGRTPDMKRRIADAVAKAVQEETGNKPETISVSIQDFAPADWMGQVYGPDIEHGAGELLVKPGYGPMAAKA